MWSSKNSFGGSFGGKYGKPVVDTGGWGAPKKPSKNRPMKRVCLYYGNMKGINGVNNAAAAGAIYAQYDVVVFAGGVQDPAYYDYANTAPVINATKAGNPSIEVFGYVPIGADPAGSSTSNLSMAAIKTKIDQWETVGATGIFLDEFGFDYLVTRERQNECVDYCHDKGMNVIANAWSIDDVWSSQNIYIGWKSFYGNPNLLPPSVNDKDYYLFENMFFKWGDEVQNASITSRVYDAIRYYQLPQAEYDGKTYYQKFGTKTIALDAIQHDHIEKDYMYHRGYLASMLLNIDGYAASTEEWANINFNHFTQDYGIVRKGLVPVTVSAHGQRQHVYYDGVVGGRQIRLAWLPDTATPESYTAGYHLVYLDGELMTTGAASMPAEIPPLPGAPADTLIASTGLVYYYSSKQGLSAGVWADYSGNGYDLNATALTTDTDGVVFNGTTSKGKLPVATPVPTQTDFTLEIGVKIPVALTATGYLILGYVGGGTVNKGVSVNSSRVVRVWDGSASRASTYTIPLNTMVILAFKRASSTSVAMYVNGVFNQNITVVNDVTGMVGTLIVGSDDTAYFKGTVAFVRQYNRSLSDAEILQNYSVGTNLW